MEDIIVMRTYEKEAYETIEAERKQNININTFQRQQKYACNIISLSWINHFISNNPELAHINNIRNHYNSQFTHIKECPTPIDDIIQQYVELDLLKISHGTYHI